MSFYFLIFDLGKTIYPHENEIHNVE